MIRVSGFIGTAFLLAGCLTQPPVPAVDRGPTAQSKTVAVPVVIPALATPTTGVGYYTVKPGDNLYRIALENGQDYKDVATWNGIDKASLIKPGQVLRVAPPGGAEVLSAGGGKPVLLAPVVETRPLDSKAVIAPATPPTPAPAVAHENLKREPKVGKEPYSDEAYARLNKLETVAKTPDPRPEIKPEIKAEPPPPLAPDEIAWIWPSTGKLLTPYSEAGNKGLDFAGKAGDPVIAAGDGKVVYAGAGLRGYGELVIVKHNATFLSAYAHNRKILVKEGQVVTRGQRIAEMGNTDADSVKLHFEIRKQGKPIDPMQFLPKK